MCVNFDTARMAIIFKIIVFANIFKAVNIPAKQPTAVKG